jgi:ABC-2 type transport system permease protein
MRWGISGMQSKTLLFNKEMVLQVGRNIGWISVIYFLALFFAIPLRIMMLYSDGNYRDFMPVERLFDFNFAIQFIMYITVPVVMAIFLYRFLHVKQAADLIHSLPLKRQDIFHFYTLTGFLFLTIPVILISMVTAIIHSAYDLNLYFQLQDIFRWTGTVVIFNAVFYLSGVFIAMVTGISVVQGVLTYIMLLFPAGFTLLIIYNLGLMLYGFPSDYYQIRNMEYLSPISHLTILEGRSISVKAVLIYIVFVLVSYVLSLFIYKKRKIEAASEAIAFNSLKVVFKYGVAFCMMLLGGMYFDAMQNKFAWLIFGYTAGGIIGYFAAEMVLQKSWRVFGKLKGLGYFAIAMAFLILITQAFAPYEKKVPALDEIKSVTYSNQVYMYPDDRLAPKPLFQQENIEAVRKFHESIIKNEKTNELRMESQEFALFVYELKNGDKLVRQYTIDRFDYEPQMREIYGSIEYKHAHQPIFKVNTDNITSIRINKHITDSPLTITDEEKINQAIAILKKEIEQEPFSIDFYPIGNRSSIEIMSGINDYDHIELKHSYKSFLAWLGENDMLKEAIVTPDDIEYIVVTNDSVEQEQFKEYPEEEIINRIMNDKNALKLSEHDQLLSAIENAGYGWFNEAPYTAIFVYKAGKHKEIRTFSDKDVPAFIKEYFK